MKRIKLLFLAGIVSISAFAQISGDGYYRIQNEYTNRYITVIDSYGYANYTGRSVDSEALETIKSYDEIASDPGSILYMKNVSGNDYDFYAQGIYSYKYFSKSLKIWDNEDGTYKAYASKSFVTMYLYDQVPISWGGQVVIPDYGSVTTKESNSDKGVDWRIIPINATNYFGVKPDVTVGSDYYKAFCACFPFTIQSTGVKAYTISKIVEAKGVAIIQEATGTIAGGTPLIFKCSSTEPSNNILNLTGMPVTGSKPIKTPGNQLIGVYFCNTKQYKDDGVTPNPHFDAVAYDPTTMRVLGISSDGKLAFVKDANLKYIPANSAYITVSSSAPDVLYVTDKEPETITGDLSGDGKVDVQDLVIEVDNILAGIYSSVADLNNDGVVDVADYVEMVDLILEK